ncbi:hypothetical protein G9A89_023123 [Geosiphon pyriformis]|nr:hypothetical protein G9A89_023123 [Geosiphon pyriformis]
MTYFIDVHHQVSYNNDNNNNNEKVIMMNDDTSNSLDQFQSSKTALSSNFHLLQDQSPQLSLQTSSTTLKKQSRQRTNTLRILIHATMQLLTSPPLSPILPTSPTESFHSTDSEQSSYISFPEYEAFDLEEIDCDIEEIRGSRGEAKCMVVQMEEFDEMLVNGIRVLQSSN